MARRIVEKYVDASFGIGIRLDWYKEVFAEFTRRPLNNPFYYAATNLISEITLGLKDNLRLDKQPIEIIFDKRVIEEQAIMHGWQHTLGESKPGNPDFTLLRSPPYFQDDEEIFPLQAADMQATLLRMQLTEDFKEDQLPGFARQIGGVFFAIDKNEMRSWLSGLLATQASGTDMV